VAEILAIHCSENEVTVLLLLRNETNWSKISGKAFNGNDAAWWVGAHYFV
jgi:hypothetical protein